MRIKKLDLLFNAFREAEHEKELAEQHNTAVQDGAGKRLSTTSVKAIDEMTDDGSVPGQTK